MYRDVLTLLNRMGLRDGEGRIYLLCLAAPQGLFTHEIVKQSKIKRSTVDVMVKRLLEQNFLTKITIGRRFQYMAQKPETLLYKQEEALNEWRDVIPLLKRINIQQSKTEVLFFEGSNGLKQVYEDVLLHLKFAEPERKEILALSSADDFMKVFPDLEKAFIAKRVKHGIRYRALYTQDNPNFSPNEKQLRTSKKISDKLDFRGDLQIYGDNVAIYSTTKPIGGVIIRNPQIASSLRSLLNFVWDLVP
jgi:sugar-specific transcriptional regulator TrmB